MRTIAETAALVCLTALVAFLLDQGGAWAIVAGGIVGAVYLAGRELMSNRKKAKKPRTPTSSGEMPIPHGGRGISMDNVRRVVVRNSDFRGNRETDIEVTNSEDITLEGNEHN